MEIVKFGNDGILDHRLWSTFGVSIKENDDSIGKFGTGLKYAIAILMREGRSLSIKSGDNEYIFGVENTEIRGKEFKQITCNGELLPFTTHLGAHWELWQAYRELYSNCLDENGDIDYEGETVIFAELGDIEHSDVFFDASKYHPAQLGKNCDIYYGESSWVYYKGIRVFELSRPGRYTYNLKSAYLTEDRTLKYPYEIDEYSGETVLQSDNHDFLIDYLTQTRNYMEEKLGFSYSNPSISKETMNVVQQFRKKDCYQHEGFIDKVNKLLGPKKYELLEPNERELTLIQKAKEFCEKIGWPIKYEIMITHDLPENTLAMADMKKNMIYLSHRVMTMGLKHLASTLLEENIHLKEGLTDCSYDMQSYLFEQIITLGEQITGDIL